MVNEEYIMKIGMLQEEGKKIEEQLNLFTQQSIELSNLQENLKNFHETKQKEILASFGKGIFFKSDVREKGFFVNVGGGIVLKKSYEETREIISRQIVQIDKIRAELVKEIQKLNSQIVELVEEVRGEGGGELLG